LFKTEKGLKIIQKQETNKNQNMPNKFIFILGFGGGMGHPVPLAFSTSGKRC
jgi:hypothetical protein